MNIAVMDIGTKATRMLIASREEFLDSGFRWEVFTNRGDLTFMGNALDRDQNIIESGTQRTIQTINKYKKEAQNDFQVDQFYAVGTGIFRMAKNGVAIAKYIEQETGIAIKILSEAEEAKYSLMSAMLTGKRNLEENDVAMMIDQGGGSTEVAFGEFGSGNKIKMPYLKSAGIGTVVLKNELFSYLNSEPNISFPAAFNKLISVSREKISGLEKYDTAGRAIKAFGLGNGITTMTGVKGNKRQHGRTLTVGEINRFANDLLDNDSSHLAWEIFPGVDSDYPDGVPRKLKYVKDLDEDQPKLIEHDLSVLFGRIGYQEILKYYGVNEITVCGAGLRYGIFFAVIFNDFK